jgi:hypothetical protein
MQSQRLVDGGVQMWGVFDIEVTPISDSQRFYFISYLLDVFRVLGKLVEQVCHRRCCGIASRNNDQTRVSGKRNIVSTSLQSAKEPAAPYPCNGGSSAGFFQSLYAFRIHPVISSAWQRCQVSSEICSVTRICYACIPVEFRFFARQSNSSRQNLRNLKRSPVAPGIEIRTRNIQDGIRGGTASMPLERRSSAQCSLQEKVVSKYHMPL